MAFGIAVMAVNICKLKP